MALTCPKHVDQPAMGACRQCGRPACGDCLVELAAGSYCKTCLEARVARPSRPVGGFARLVLSIVPGLGHLYMGLFNRGLQIMAGAVLGSVLIGMIFTPILGLWIPISVFFSIFDAREAHLRLAQGLEVQDLQVVDLRAHWHPRWVAYVLIILGLLALYNTLIGDVLRLVLGSSMVYYRVASIIRTVTMAVLAISAGLWLLRGSASRLAGPTRSRNEAAAVMTGQGSDPGGKGDAA